MIGRLLLLLALACSPLARAAAAPPSWELVWGDEFTKSGAPDSKKWNIETDFVRNENAQQLYTDRKQNIAQERGKLVLTAKVGKHKNGRFDPNGSSWREKREFADYTSGSVNSAGKFSFRYGRLVICAAIEHGKGVWPALWLIGESPGKTWPQCGEIDLLEYISQNKDRVHGTLHWDKAYNSGPGLGRTVSYKAPDVLDGFHEYEMIWTPEKIAFLYDGKPYYSFEIEKAAVGGYNAFRNPHHLVLNLAVGGWAERADPAEYPRRFMIDYVRVYQDRNVKDALLIVNGNQKKGPKHHGHSTHLPPPRKQA